MMKKLLTILILLTSLSGFSQFIKPNNSYGTIGNRGLFDSTLFFPTGCGIATLRSYDLHRAAQYFDSCGNTLYIYNPSTKTWGTIVGDTTGLKHKTDSINIITGYTTLYQNSLKSAYVGTIAALQSYNGLSNTVIVQDSLRGGTFNYVTSGIPDGGIVFTRTNGGYWQRNISQSHGINIKWFGAKGDNSTNDTTAVNSWFLYCINNQKKGFVPAGNYNVTSVNSPFLSSGAGVQAFGFVMQGSGPNSSIFYVNGTYAGKSIINFTNLRQFEIYDVGFLQNGGTTGTAINLTHAVNSIIKNVNITGFDKAIYITQNYNTSMDKVSTFSNNIGLYLNGNSFNLDNLDVETSSQYGIFVQDTTIAGFPGASVTLNGGLIQSNSVGIKIGRGDLTCNATYFEANNTNGDILAGVDVGNLVSNVNIYNCQLSYQAKIIIDRVAKFFINSKDNNNYKNINITPNTEYVDMPTQWYNYSILNGDHEYINSNNNNRQTSFPYWTYDFRNDNTVSNTTATFNVDTKSHITILPIRANYKDTTDFLTGANALIFHSTPGSNAGIRIRIDSVALPVSDYLTMTANLKMNVADTLGYTLNVNINYTDVNGVAQSYASYSYSPAVAGYSYNLAKWLTTSMPINISAFKIAVPNYRSVSSVDIYFYFAGGLLSNIGNEMLTLDKISLYPAKYANNVHTDNLNAISAPYEFRPKNLTADNLTYNANPTMTTGNQVTNKTYVDSSGALKANDNAVVHTAGVETITGAKTLTGTTNLSGYINTNSSEVTLPNVSFPASANQAVKLQLGNNAFYGYIIVELTATYSGEIAAGKLTKEFAVGINTGNNIYNYESRVSDAMGAVFNNFAIGELQWDAGLSQYIIPISHLTSTGNVISIKVKLFARDNVYVSNVYSSLSTSAVYTLTALQKNVVNYNNKVYYTTTPTMLPLDSLALIDKKYADSIHNLSVAFQYDLQNTEDLNTITTTGFYHQGNNANATLAHNYPVTYSGLLRVYNADAGLFVYQYYHSYELHDTTYYRSQYGGTWSSWKIYAIQSPLKLGPGFGTDAAGDSLFRKERIFQIASAATHTPNVDTTSFYIITAQAVAATIANPTGATSLEGTRLEIRIKDNGAAQTLTWGTAYRGSTGLSLPATTTLGKTMHMYFEYDAIDAKYDLVNLRDGF